jgi:hypothetical protein
MAQRPNQSPNRPGGQGGWGGNKLRPRERRSICARQLVFPSHPPCSIVKGAHAILRACMFKRASSSRPSGEWNDDDFDVLADGIVVGRIFMANAAPVGSPWMWTLAFGHHEDRIPTHGYEATREVAMAAFAKSWRRE